jgi:hypothetical protein
MKLEQQNLNDDLRNRRCRFESGPEYVKTTTKTRQKIGKLAKKIKYFESGISPMVERLYQVSDVYSGMVCKPLCDAVQNRLPRELRDMVYGHLNDFRGDEFCVNLRKPYAALIDPAIPHESYSNLFRTTGRRIGNGSRRCAYYLDPTIVSDTTSQEVLELLYRTSKFKVLHDAMISKTPKEDLSKRGIVPMRWLSNIEIVIPAEFYEREDRRAALHEHFEFLKQLTNTRARIAVKIDFDGCDHLHNGFIDWTKVFRHIEFPGHNELPPLTIRRVTTTEHSISLRGRIGLEAGLTRSRM